MVKKYPIKRRKKLGHSSVFELQATRAKAKAQQELGRLRIAVIKARTQEEAGKIIARLKKKWYKK